MKARKSANPKSHDGQALGPLAGLAVIFALSRLLFFLAGVRFDASGLNNLAQFIDPALLKNNLWQSLFYLHSQPPLYNLFLGVVLQIFPGHETAAFYIFSLLTGLAFYLALYLLIKRLEVPGPISWGLTVIFMVSPASILYENWLFYTYPLAMVLCSSAYFLHRFLSTKKLRHGAIFFSLLAVLALVHSMFHLLWFVLVGGVLLCYFPEKKKVLLACSVPFLIILALYIKNFLVFGSFTSSSWLGMNLSRETTFMMPFQERKSLAERGELSVFSLVPAFPPLGFYENECQPLTSTGVAVLDQKVNSTGGYNFNHAEYLEASKIYFRDALWVMSRHPEAYGRGMAHSFLFYFLPASNYHRLDGNREKIRGWDDAFNFLFQGRVADPMAPAAEREAMKQLYVPPFWNMSLLLVCGFPFLALFGLWLASKSLEKARKNLAFSLTLLFVWFNILYVTLVGNSLEVGENNRFRFIIDPLYVVLLALFLKMVWEKMTRRFAKK